MYPTYILALAVVLAQDVLGAAFTRGAIPYGLTAVNKNSSSSAASASVSASVPSFGPFANVTTHGPFNNFTGHGPVINVTTYNPFANGTAHGVFQTVTKTIYVTLASDTTTTATTSTDNSTVTTLASLPPAAAASVHATAQLPEDYIWPRPHVPIPVRTGAFVVGMPKDPPDSFFGIFEPAGPLGFPIDPHDAVGRHGPIDPVIEPGLGGNAIGQGDAILPSAAAAAAVTVAVAPMITYAVTFKDVTTFTVTEHVKTVSVLSSAKHGGDSGSGTKPMPVTVTLPLMTTPTWTPKFGWLTVTSTMTKMGGTVVESPVLVPFHPKYEERAVVDEEKEIMAKPTTLATMTRKDDLVDPIATPTVFMPIPVPVPGDVEE